MHSMMVAKLAPQVIAEERKIYKGVCPNVDFYSGFAYQMLNLPEELYTPIFAIARIAGWSAHRLEELCHSDKIMRPAYKSVTKYRAYTPRRDLKEDLIDNKEYRSILQKGKRFAALAADLFYMALMDIRCLEFGVILFCIQD